MGVTVTDVLERLDQLDRGALSLGDIEEWAARRAWEPAVDDDLDARDLIGDIELLFAEFTSHHRTEEELKRLILGLRSPIRISIGTAPRSVPRVTTTSTAPSLTLTFGA